MTTIQSIRETPTLRLGLSSLHSPPIMMLGPKFEQMSAEARLYAWVKGDIISVDVSPNWSLCQHGFNDVAIGVI